MEGSSVHVELILITWDAGCYFNLHTEFSARIFPTCTTSIFRTKMAKISRIAVKSGQNGWGSWCSLTRIMFVHPEKKNRKFHSVPPTAHWKHKSFSPATTTVVTLKPQVINSSIKSRNFCPLYLGKQVHGNINKVDLVPNVFTYNNNHSLEIIVTTCWRGN